ncbi:AAA family ATPase [Rhizobium leguminosarum]|uniref:AAA family ATPase n=1 Tax=Rhizobium leguminosarum TaxID=384 RepID=A0AAJ1A5Y3_RHILE|nr:AAA family ATPase [Rhizobium leguminosarum]MBY5533127.1 AAA family ATPase [Rhizobium leguminosarum]MBY5593982.1 AAA family ATPase [Rhizobium leguminosarum]MBY5614315.1 AAA family ATPase [Rhizobium leguminosarum]MBY5627723.1 AAA family ATPase [Rhizobium leguminosarum]MBY5728978.1 AAA family ATPase [Rhizobium leguminosarum]
MMDQRVDLPPHQQITDLKQAVEHIRTARRILVIGCSGGGKSTLSLKIARRFGLSYISLDRDVFWLPGWVVRDRVEQRTIIASRILEERWIMDGTNPSSLDIRLPRTDFVVWVRMPRLVCIWGAISRWAKWVGRTRPEMAPGCIEKVDLEFLRFIWTFEEKFAPRLVAGIAAHGPEVPVLQLKSRAQMRGLLDLLGRPA